MSVITEIDPVMKAQMWDRIRTETEQMERYFSDMPIEIARRFEADKKAEYERLVLRLKNEGTW